MAAGRVTYGSAGNGGSAHLAAALLETSSGAKMTHVPFRGNAPALTEVSRKRLEALGAINIGDSPAEFTAFLKKDRERRARVIKAAGVKAE